MTANNELTLEFGLPGLNKIISAAKQHPSAYARMKKKYTQMVEGELIRQGCVPIKPYDSVKIGFIWIEGGNLRDPDNIRTGAKFVLDAMVNCGVIEDDSLENVNLIQDSFLKGRERSVIVRWSVRNF